MRKRVTEPMELMRSRSLPCVLLERLPGHAGLMMDPLEINAAVRCAVCRSIASLGILI
jgi:hypothetical protein